MKKIGLVAGIIAVTLIAIGISYVLLETSQPKTVEKKELLETIRKAFENQDSRDAAKKALEEVEKNFKGKTIKMTGKVINWHSEEEIIIIELEREECGVINDGSFAHINVYVDFKVTTENKQIASEIEKILDKEITIEGEIESIRWEKIRLLPMRIVVDVNMKLKHIAAS